MRCADLKGLVAHHIVALADGGADDPGNCITLCSGCHAEWHAVEAPQIDFDDFLHSIPAFLTQVIMALVDKQDDLRDVTAKDMNDAWALTLWARIKYNHLSGFGRRELTSEELASDPHLAIAARRYQRA